MQSHTCDICILLDGFCGKCVFVRHTGVMIYTVYYTFLYCYIELGPYLSTSGLYLVFRFMFQTQRCLVFALLLNTLLCKQTSQGVFNKIPGVSLVNQVTICRINLKDILRLKTTNLSMFKIYPLLNITPELPFCQVPIICNCSTLLWVCCVFIVCGMFACPEGLSLCFGNKQTNMHFVSFQFHTEISNTLKINLFIIIAC